MASNRGGMSPNSFGGRKRLDHLDLMTYRIAATTPEKMLYLATIQDAAHNYLFFGLGRNGTSADEFAAACKYFFTIRSDKPATWPSNMVIKEDPTTERPSTYTKSQIEGMCFDKHYDYAGLTEIISLDVFVRWLQEERKRLLTKNWEQVKTYISVLRNKYYQESLGSEKSITFQNPPTDIKAMEILVAPKTIQQFAQFIYRTKPSICVSVPLVTAESAVP